MTGGSGAGGRYRSRHRFSGLLVQPELAVVERNGPSHGSIRGTARNSNLLDIPVRRL
jgi:hypothetical protein